MALPMDFKKFLLAFRYAFAGLFYTIKSEQNMRVHLVVTLAVAAGGVYFHLKDYEWIALILAIGLVVAAETFNTAIERLADRVTRQEDDLIRYAKDSAAAAVMILAIASALVGAIIFLPRFLALFS